MVTMIRYIQLSTYRKQQYADDAHMRYLRILNFHLSSIGSRLPARVAENRKRDGAGRHFFTLLIDTALPAVAGRGGTGRMGLLAVSSGFGDQVDVVSACRVDEGVIVSLAA
jgi:hypothetical protein